MGDDRELWKRLCRQDEDAFNAFYGENAPRLCAFLRQVTGNAQAAEDVTQETFARIWNRPNGFDPERGSLRTYLFGMGRKRAAEWWRSQAAVEPLTADPVRASQAEISSLVGDAFQRLGAGQRTLLWLREVEGQSYAELAAILEIPVGTVRSRLFSAREALRTIWLSKRQQEKGGRHDVQ